jgi:arylsulfatase A-like enzyme
MATGMHDFGGNRLPVSSTTLAKVLRDHDYSTAPFLGAAVLDSRFGLTQGFETYFDHFAFNRMDDLLKRPGDQVTDNASAWLKTIPRRPFFVWVHLYDAHTPTLLRSHSRAAILAGLMMGKLRLSMFKSAD